MGNENNVFVVSGGGRGITAQCVLKLAANFPCKLILLGRSQLIDIPEWAIKIDDEKELKKQAFAVLHSHDKKINIKGINQLVKNILATREIKNNLEILRNLNTEVEYLSVDINAVNLSQKIAPIATKFGQITGIIHGAGVLADKLIAQKTEADFDRVYSTKVDGLYNLLECINSEQLKHLILFSSVAGFYGNIGQADYALANEILNKFAHQFKHQHPNCRVVSFNWGPWSSGMVTPELKAIFQQRGVEVIPVEVGTNIFVEQLVQGNNEQVQILVGGGLAHPMIELEPELKSYRIRRQLTLANNPFLVDHLIGNNAVLPMVFAIAWLANCAEEIYVGYQVFSCTQFKVLKGIIFDQTLAGEYILEIQEIEKILGQKIHLSAKIWSENEAGKIRYHYQGNLKLVTSIPKTPIYVNVNYQQNPELVNLSPYRDGTLFHGYGFQGVKRVFNISDKTLTMECQLPEVDEAYWGQFPPRAFNPLAIDIQLQCALIWVRYFHDTACLPLQCQKGEHFRDIPLGKPFYVSMEVEVHTATKLIANITSHDQEGRIYARVVGEVTISKQLNHLFVSAKEQEINQLITFWRNFVGVKHPVGEALYSGLYRQFVGEIILEDRQDFQALEQQPRLYLANHQVGIESIIFLFAISGLTNCLTHTVAKIEHQHSWMKELSNQIYAYPQLDDPELIFYFDRNNPLSMLKLLKAIKTVMIEQKRSLLVHVQGTRAFSCRQPVSDLSAVFLDLVLELNLPVIPVKFVGGLPIEPLTERLEFPYRYTYQNYHLGKAIYPEHLQALGNVERKNLILDKLNQLDGSIENNFPHQPNLEFEQKIYLHRKKTGVDEVRAVFYQILEDIPKPTNEVETLLKIIAGEDVELNDSAEGNWLREFAKWLGNPNSTPILK